jgi:hypothetical protein
MQRPSTASLDLLPTPRVDWPGYGQALLRSAYALVLLLVTLLPANFVAYALLTTLYHGSALAGLEYALGHRHAGYWIGTQAHAAPAGAALWWLAATTESLFWVGCASALLLFALWMARFAAGYARPRRPQRPGRARRAAGRSIIARLPWH